MVEMTDTAPGFEKAFVMLFLPAAVCNLRSDTAAAAAALQLRLSRYSYSCQVFLSDRTDFACASSISWRLHRDARRGEQGQIVPGRYVDKKLFFSCKKRLDNAEAEYDAARDFQSRSS